MFIYSFLFVLIPALFLPFLLLLLLFYYFYLFIYFLFFLKVDPEPLSVYHPMSREFPTAMGMPIEGFFNEADIVADAIAFAFVVAHGALAEILVRPPKLVLVEEST